MACSYRPLRAKYPPCRRCSGVPANKTSQTAQACGPCSFESQGLRVPPSLCSTVRGDCQFFVNCPHRGKSQGPSIQAPEKIQAPKPKQTCGDWDLVLPWILDAWSLKLLFVMRDLDRAAADE